MEKELAEFKKQLRSLSKNELVRQAADFYMRLTISQFQVQALLEEKKNQNSSETEQKSEQV